MKTNPASGLYTRLIRKSRVKSSGASAGVLTLFPSRRVKTRIQAAHDHDVGLSKQQKQTVLGLLLRIWHKEGLPGFFKGFSANMINTFSMRMSNLCRRKYQSLIANPLIHPQNSPTSSSTAGSETGRSNDYPGTPPNPSSNSPPPLNYSSALSPARLRRFLRSPSPSSRPDSNSTPRNTAPSIPGWLIPRVKSSQKTE